MPKIEFAPWARQLGLFSSAYLALFGIPCFFYPDPGISVGIYSVIVGVLWLPFLWPLHHLGRLLMVTQIYWLMALLLAACSVYPYFLAPTFLGALMLDVCAVLYVVAALRKEKHLTPEELREGGKDLWQKM